MNCIIVDDEPIALDGIAEYVHETPFLKLLGKCNNAYEAIQLISEKPVDLIFLDINMPKLNGVDMVNSLQQPPMIIFVTAYPNYALKGFELNAVDYILKPISYEKFLKASQKAYNFFILEQTKSLTEKKDFIYVKVDKRLVKIMIADILFIQGMKDYILIHTTIQKYITYLSLNKIIKALPEADFLQIHKSFIISTNAIDVIEGNKIEIGKNLIPIGRVYKNILFEKIVDKKYLKK